VRAGLFGSVRLLSFHRFAFPAARHTTIIGRFSLRPLRSFFACFAVKSFEAVKRRSQRTAAKVAKKKPGLADVLPYIAGRRLNLAGLLCRDFI
jgi:hypothetical protein